MNINEEITRNLIQMIKDFKKEKIKENKTPTLELLIKELEKTLKKYNQLTK